MRMVVLIVAALLLGLTFLMVQSTTPDEVLHGRTLDALRRMDRDNAALQRDVLRARAGLLRNYDPLVQSVERLRETAASLRAASRIATGGHRVILASEIGGLMATVARQEAMVESFKTRNALLQNSLSVFSHLLQDLAPDSNPGSPGAAQFRALGSAMLRMSSDPEEAVQDIAAALDRLQYPLAEASFARRMQPLVAHGRMIVATLPAVDAAINALQALPTDNRVRTIQDLYLDAYGQAATRAGRFRISLYAAAVLLATYVVYLFLRLRRTAQTLRQRLAFEQTIADVSAGFINLPIEDIDNGIAQGLARLAQDAGVDGARIILIADAEPGTAPTTVARDYSWHRPDWPDEAVAPEEMLEIAEALKRLQDAHAPVYLPRVAAIPDSAEKARLTALGIRSWLSIPMGHSGRCFGHLVFEMVTAERHWPRDDIALLQTAAGIFASAVERVRTDSAREALEARLAEAQRLESLGTLAGGIAHEFNNILGAIMGYGELSLAALRSGDPARAHVRQVMRAGMRAQSVIDQILAFSRRQERRYRPIQADAAVMEAVQLLNASLPATLQLRTQIAQELPAIIGDPTEIQQVVMNLCTNAAHAMEGTGTIDLRLDRVEIGREIVLSHGRLAPGSHLRLAVRDSGHGIPPETMAHIFEPFFTTKSVGRGTGLGLPTVHGIVTAHGGAIDVRSAPGLGSTFEAFFPATDERAAVEDEAPASPVRRGRGETILLVDDEQPLVLLGEEMLAALGYEAVGFHTSAAAEAAFRADPQRFDLVLTDELMPETTGTELAARLRRIRPDLPVVLMTGHLGGINAPRARSAAIAAILKKPLRSRTLAECLARHLPAGEPPPAGTAQPRAAKPRRGVLEPSGREGA